MSRKFDPAHFSKLEAEIQKLISSYSTKREELLEKLMAECPKDNEIYQDFLINLCTMDIIQHLRKPWSRRMEKSEVQFIHTSVINYLKTNHKIMPAVQPDPGGEERSS